MLFSLLSRTRIKGVVGALLAQTLGKQCFPGLATIPPSTGDCVCGICVVGPLSPSGPSLWKNFWHSRGECLRQEKKPLAFPNNHPHTKACPCLDGAPLTIHCSSTELCTLQFVLNYTGKEKSVSPGELLRTYWGKLSILITEEILAELMLKGNYLSFSSDFAKQLAK